MGFHTAKSVPIVQTLPAEYRVMAQSFRRSLLTQNKSERTVTTYIEAVRLFGNFLVEHGMPTDVTAITREHVEEFVADQLPRWKPATANNRYRSLQAIFRWLIDEGEVPVSIRPRLTLEWRTRHG